MVAIIVTFVTSIEMFLIECYDYFCWGTLKKKSIPKLKFLHKCTSNFRVFRAKTKSLRKNYQVSLSSRGKIFNGRNRISRRTSWKQR